MIIYKIKNKLNGKVYIGQTARTLKERWIEHCWRIREKAKLHLYAALALYGRENFEAKELALTDDQETTNQVEAFFIWYYDSTNPEKGYNNSLGGAHGKHSEKTKKLLSEIQKGKTINENQRRALRDGSSKGDWLRGKHLSLEHRQNISAALKGNPRMCFPRQKWSPERKDAHSKILLGRKVTPEHARRISEGKKNNPNTRLAALRGWATRRMNHT